jgi:glucose/arabinose dehydrogenase
VLVALPAPSAEARPKLNVSILASGLSNPWDVTWVGSLMLFDERSGRVWSKRPGYARMAVRAPLPDLFVNGKGGLMGMVADPAAATNKWFCVC